MSVIGKQSNKRGRPEKFTLDVCQAILVDGSKRNIVSLKKLANMRHVPYISLHKALLRHGLKSVGTSRTKVVKQTENLETSGVVLAA